MKTKTTSFYLGRINFSLRRDPPLTPRCKHLNQEGTMKHADVLRILKAGNQPDPLILLDDGEFFIERNANNSFETGNGFLQYRCKEASATPGGWECIGGYDHQQGTWNADINIVPNPETDCRRLGDYGTVYDAIAALWLSRHEAYRRH
jgi:hypothetical protein